MDGDDDDQDSSSRHLLVPIEDLLKRSQQQQHFNDATRAKIRYRSKSVDNLYIDRLKTDRSSCSYSTRTQCNLAELIDDQEEQSDEHSSLQRSRSAPISTRDIYEQELAGFLHDNNETDCSSHFVYNIDLSTTTLKNCLAEIFHDDELTLEPLSSLLHHCLTIAEENEDELEELKREKICNDERSMTHLSTIYECPSPPSCIDDVEDEKLIVYDVAMESNNKEKLGKHIQRMKMISSSSTSLSDFLSPNSIPTADPRQSSTTVSSSSSSSSSSSDALSNSKVLCRSETRLESMENLGEQRKATRSKLVYPMDLIFTENRINETMRELEIEQALLDSEHQLVFKEILDASEFDEEKLRQLNEHLQLLMQRIVKEKNLIRQQISSTEEILRQLQKELNELERDDRPSDEKIRQKKQFLVRIQNQYEDLEFQLMELETRCETELEQAQEEFQHEQRLVNENMQQRQKLLRDFDQQQEMIVYQMNVEKEKLEREKRSRTTLPRYQNDELIRLRDRTRLQERPLTRYLPNRSIDFDLRAHIEGAGHCCDWSHLSLTSTSCRGFLHKLGGMKFKVWNRRWFVFDRQRRSLFYFQDKSERKLRGSIDFQSIIEVYVDHLQIHSVRSPLLRQAAFVMKTNERTFYFVAPTIESMRIWIDVLITGAEGNTFFEK